MAGYPKTCVVELFLLCGLMMAGHIQNHSLGIVAWNVRCNLACAGPYLQVLSKEAEFIAISEHGLYPCEMNKLNESIPGYIALAKASRQLKDEDFGHKRGHGGCAILWSEKLNNRVRPMPNLGSDRICVLQVTTSECNIYVIAVYMPHKGCKIAEFKDEMECLERVCNECNSNGHTVVIGDMNAHLGAELGGRCWGQTSSNGKMLVQTMYRCGMSILDTGVKCGGPVYTFTSTTDQSYIDHCAVSNGLLPFISECQVMPEHLFNVSDHLAMLLNVQANQPYVMPNLNRRQVAWGKIDKNCIKELYTYPLEQNVNELLRAFQVNPELLTRDGQNCPTIENPEKLELFIQTLTNVVNLTSAQLPQTKFSKALKPYWCESLGILNREKKLAMRQWQQAGRPRDPSDHIYVRYKEAKRNFRREQRIKVYEYETECISKIAESAKLDQRFFWHMVNKYKKKSAVSRVVSENGNILIEPDAIWKEWNENYKTLYSNSDEDEFDDGFRNYVVKELKRHDSSGCVQLEGGDITVAETIAETKEMKNKKVPGWDQVTIEHLKYSGELMMNTVTWLINSMVRPEIIPNFIRKD